jgi:heterodisulfide reductase subunit C
MSNAMERLASQYRLFLCMQCGTCVAACPMWQIFDDFSHKVSPRMVVARATRGLEKLEHVGIWFCLTCDLCTDLCPAGVRFRDFAEAARQLAIEEGITEHGSFCCKCGAYLWPLHTVQYLKQMLGETSEELLTLCPKCRRHDFGNKVKALTPGSRRVYTEERQVGEG